MKKLANALGLLTGLVLASCTSTTPNWDARFGEAARTLTAQQVIDPDAAKNPDPVAGMDGKAAAGAVDAYAKSYAQPEPQPEIFTIGVGSGGSGR